MKYLMTCDLKWFNIIISSHVVLREEIQAGISRETEKLRANSNI